MTTSRIQAWYQNQKKHLILAQFRNSPWTASENVTCGSKTDRASRMSAAAAFVSANPALRCGFFSRAMVTVLKS